MSFLLAARVRDQFEISLADDPGISLDAEQESASAVMRMYCRLVETIDTLSHSLGKDGKFQLLVCLAARYLQEHVCCKILKCILVCFCYYRGIHNPGPNFCHGFVIERLFVEL